MRNTTNTLKKYIVLLFIGLGLFISCGEKKNTEAAIEKAETEMKVKKEQVEVEKKEVLEKAEAIKKTEAERMEKEKMKADSIRQVKEHGHAH